MMTSIRVGLLLCLMILVPMACVQNPVAINEVLSPETAKEPVNTLFQEAFQHHQAGKLEKALALYDRVIALNPDHVAAYWNRALIYSQQGNHEAAIADQQEAIRLARAR